MIEYKDRYKLHPVLLKNLKDNMSKLEELLKEANSHWGYEDAIYRFYHHSFKVYHLQELTAVICNNLAKIAPDEKVKIDSYFMQIVKKGVNKEFDLKHNKRWTFHTRPILEAFFHAKFMLEMAVKYGKELDEAPQVLPSGWAALLYLYGLR